MITKRIIPCLDVKDGRVVKGVNFQGLNDVSSPIELAEYYSGNGADELVFYDITASAEGRKLFTDILRETARRVFIPLTVGGGISTVADFERVLACGADKVSVNTGAIQNPSLIREAAKLYGDQCVVLSADVKRVGGEFHVFVRGGREDTGMEAIGWIRRCVDEGAGEVVVNSIDTDGVKGGFDLEMLKAVCEAVSVPVIASGGAGGVDDFITLFKTLPRVDAGLAASIFHFGTVRIEDLKARMAAEGIPVRLTRARDKLRMDDLKFDDRGLIPAVVADADTKQVLTLAYMSRESLKISMERGLTCFWSRSRQKLWLKGETSGNFQHIVSITADCDRDALLILVRPEGPACHLGNVSCFEDVLWTNEAQAPAFSLRDLMALIKDRRDKPVEGSYTSYLFEKGLDKILKKVGEESTEVIIAAKGESAKGAGTKGETVYELADLTYHLLVLMAQTGVSIEDVMNELASRHVIDHKVKQERMSAKAASTGSRAVSVQ